MSLRFTENQELMEQSFHFAVNGFHLGVWVSQRPLIRFMACWNDQFVVARLRILYSKEIGVSSSFSLIITVNVFVTSVVNISFWIDLINGHDRF